jgi:clan AA aspartic protease (TIGR02281 family)
VRAALASGLLVIERRMMRVPFNAIALLVFGIAWIGVASAQSFSRPCPPIGYYWSRCIGTYTWASGDKYVGEWTDDKVNGKGTYTYANGRSYVGEFRDGEPNGQGTFTWPDGSKYVGEWRAGTKHGKGTYTYPDGDSYVGEFRDGKRNGQGTETWRGETYIGEWKDDYRNGQGTMTFSNGTKYVGEYLHGVADGQGTETRPNGDKYVGGWQAGTKHGKGKQYSSNGELVREGYWVWDEYYGPKAPDGGRVKMVEGGGIYHVPVVINNALKLDFIVDSGASDVCIPADVVRTLMRTGTIKKSDFIGTEKYSLADGSTVESRTFIIRSLKVGDRTVTDVRASIADVNGPLLLGQSFLKRFKSWSQDNAAHELILQ